MLKKLTIITTLSTLLLAGVASAHMGTDLDDRDEIMQQMMGEKAFGTMEQMQEQMMGLDNHERMDALMDKMFAGSLTADEQKEMVDLMKNSETASGATLMMTGGLLPQMMSGSGLASGERFGGMMNGGMMSGNWTGKTGYFASFWWIHWLTVILVWTVLVLGIASLWRYLKRK